MSDSPKKIDPLTGRVVTYLGPLDEGQTFPRDVPADVGRALQKALAEADRQRAEVARLKAELAQSDRLLEGREQLRVKAEAEIARLKLNFEQAYAAEQAAEAEVARLRDRMVAAFGEGTDETHLVEIAHEHERETARADKAEAENARLHEIEAHVLHLLKPHADKIQGSWVEIGQAIEKQAAEVLRLTKERDDAEAAFRIKSNEFAAETARAEALAKERDDAREAHRLTASILVTTDARAGALTKEVQEARKIHIDYVKGQEPEERDWAAAFTDSAAAMVLQAFGRIRQPYGSAPTYQSLTEYQSRALDALQKTVVREEPFSAEGRAVLARAEAAEASAKALREAIAKAPHGFGCLSMTIIEGRPPAALADPPQVFRPRQPPDERLCNCWKRAALAPPNPSAEKLTPTAAPAPMPGPLVCDLESRPHVKGDHLPGLHCENPKPAPLAGQKEGP